MHWQSRFYLKIMKSAGVATPRAPLGDKEESSPDEAVRVRRAEARGEVHQTAIRVRVTAAAYAQHTPTRIRIDAIRNVGCFAAAIGGWNHRPRRCTAVTHCFDIAIRARQRDSGCSIVCCRIISKIAGGRANINASAVHVDAVNPVKDIRPQTFDVAILHRTGGCTRGS